MQDGCPPTRPKHARPRYRPAAPVLVALAFLATTSAAQEPTEHEVKAAFMFHFARLVTWPSWPSVAEPDAPFEIAVVGRDPFGDALESTIGSTRVQGRPIRVRRAPTAAALERPPQLLFVADTDPSAARRALAAVEARPVLTVGEAPGFAESGGMIGFRLTPDGRVTFDVNLASAERSGLRVSSQLLRVARVVEAKP
jgi:hypothetical protein